GEQQGHLRGDRPRRLRGDVARGAHRTTLQLRAGTLETSLLRVHRGRSERQKQRQYRPEPPLMHAHSPQTSSTERFPATISPAIHACSPASWSSCTTASASAGATTATIPTPIFHTRNTSASPPPPSRLST